MSGLEWFLFVVVIACGGGGLAYGVVTRNAVLAMPAGNPRMQEIAAAIQEGAGAYLNRQYMTIAAVGFDGTVAVRNTGKGDPSRGADLSSWALEHAIGVATAKK